MDSYLTFKSISVGTVFRITGLKGADEGRYRKMSAGRASHVQDSTWRDIPAEWPITLADDKTQTDNILPLELQIGAL